MGTIENLILASMALLLGAVKTSAANLPSSNQEKSLTSTLPTNSTYNISKLVQTVLNSGEERGYRNGYAQAIGLSGPMPSKGFHVSLNGHGYHGDDRDIDVVYATDSPRRGNRPVYLYFRRGHGTEHDASSLYFRINLNGQLEKVINLKNKLDGNGNPVREGRTRIEDDINSPEIQKAFKTEMEYWLNDWLKKQTRH